MSEPGLWILINARETSDAGIAADTHIAGLSLVTRHARMAERQGWQGAVIQVSDGADQRELEAALLAQPAPATFVVEYVTAPDSEPEGRRYIPVSLHAVYGASELARAADEATAPTPLVQLDEPGDLRKAERALFQQIRKSIHQDGIVAYHTQRPISRQMTRALLDTRVTPNQVTLAAMACGLIAAVGAGIGGHYPILVAAFFYWFGAVVDCIDGELARLRVKGSKMGEWLDTLADDVATFGLLTGLGIGLARDGYGDHWAILSITGAVVGFAVQAKLYADLHRWGMTIDTAQYPWFFGKPSEGKHKRTFFGQLFYVISFGFRRDAFVTVIAIMLALGLRRAALVALCSGMGIVVAMFLVHNLVKLVRPSKDDGAT